jgi:hypothetical protein
MRLSPTAKNFILLLSGARVVVVASVVVVGGAVVVVTVVSGTEKLSAGASVSPIGVQDTKVNTASRQINSLPILFNINILEN